jgi:outer membrane receptor for ferrienterochelin and colicin
MSRLRLSLLLALTLAACVKASNSPQSTQRDLITEEEIASSHAMNAYEAVQKLRGNFLSDRGKTTILGRSPSKPTVFVDGIQFGEIQSLRTISASVIQSIRLYRAYEAEQRYGNGVMGGVIEVTTKK